MADFKDNITSFAGKAMCKIGKHDWYGCKCTRCGEVRDEGHNYQMIDNKCEQRCSICGKILKIPHQWKNKKCIRCGAFQKANWLLIEIITAVIIIIGLIFVFSNINNSSDKSEGIKITSTSSQYKGKNYQDVLTGLQTLGFTNIETKPQEDLIAGWLIKDNEVESVSVNGDIEYRANKKFPSDVKISIIYHTFPKSESDLIAELEKHITKENAKRAAVVAITNAYATDVFMEDKNTYDISKFHSWANQTGDYMELTYEGNWKPKDKDTWQVTGLKLKNASYGTYATVSCDVDFNSENYIVSNITGNLGNNVDLSELEKGTKKPYLTVSPSLILEDRVVGSNNHKSNETEEKPTKPNYERNPLGVSSWDGDHTELKKLIKKNMNDEKSYKHIETKWIYIEDTTKQKEINKVLSKIGWSNKVSIGDFVIITEFSGRNSYNATVKNTAYGIEYENGSVKLLGIV